MIKVFTPGYFAREDTRTPMLFAGVSVAVNVALALTLFPIIAEAGIATAESVSGWVNASLLFFMLRRRGHFTLDATAKRNLPRIVLCCAIMAVVLYGGILVLRPYFQPEAGILRQVGALLLLMGGGGLVYFAAAELTGAMSLRAIVSNIRRKPRAS
jgi:putative peptidoglycan lipid II flippase